MPDFTGELHTIVSVGTRLAFAYVLSLPLAWNREHQDRSAGLRTFPLVGIASTGYSLVAISVFSGSPDAQSRVLQGLLAGMGFIGGGAILRLQRSVHGTATAASIWATAAIGVACAYSEYEIAAMLSVASFATLRYMTRLKDPGRDDGDGSRESTRRSK